MHVHIGAQEWLTFFLFLIATGYLLRQVSAKLVQSDQPFLHSVGQALGAIY